MDTQGKTIAIDKKFYEQTIAGKSAGEITAEGKKRRKILKPADTSQYTDANKAEDLYNALCGYELVTLMDKNGPYFVHAWDKQSWNDIAWCYEDAQGNTVKKPVECSPKVAKKNSKSKLFANIITTLANLTWDEHTTGNSLADRVPCLYPVSDGKDRCTPGEYGATIDKVAYTVFHGTSTGQKILDIVKGCKSCEDARHQNLRLILSAVEKDTNVTAPPKVDDDALKTASDNESQGKLFLELQDLINNGAYQLILTGAPGTGKTFQAKKVANAYRPENRLYNYYSENDTTLDKFIARVLYDQSFYEDVKAGYLGEGFDQLTQTAIDEICQAITPTLEVDETYDSDDFWNDVADLRGLCALVQFHPSYDYTDFIEGLRPVEGESGEMQFKRMDGSFMAFCRYVAWQNAMADAEDDAKAHSEAKPRRRPHYFFIIDEINRADLSKVLGELMFCLEGDKRGENNRIFTQYKNLAPYFLQEKNHSKVAFDAYGNLFSNGFFIPENVVVIGTMNNIDRSVESMDFALRRRFTWKDVVVNETLLKDSFASNKFFQTVEKDLREPVVGLICRRILDFNQRLRGETMHQVAPHLNSDYDISQGHFTNLAPNAIQSTSTTKEAVAHDIMGWVWDYRIASLLKEYLRGCEGYQGFDPLLYLQGIWNRTFVPAPAGVPDSDAPQDATNTQTTDTMQDAP